MRKGGKWGGHGRRKGELKVTDYSECASERGLYVYLTLWKRESHHYNIILPKSKYQTKIGFFFFFFFWETKIGWNGWNTLKFNTWWKMGFCVPMLGENTLLVHTFWTDSHFGLYFDFVTILVPKKGKSISFWSLLSTH